MMSNGEKAILVCTCGASCRPAEVRWRENELAYARLDSNSLAPGHVIVVPRRHVADFFDMTAEEQAAVLALLNEARNRRGEALSPTATTSASTSGALPASRACTCTCTLIPRYAGDVPDPRGGIRRV